MKRYFVDPREWPSRELCPGVRAYPAAGAEMLLSYVEFEPRAVVPAHSHPHEQVGVLLEGELTFEIGGQWRVVRPGQMWRIPGGVVHSAKAGDQRAVAVDVFHPVREEYRLPEPEDAPG